MIKNMIHLEKLYKDLKKNLKNKIFATMENCFRNIKFGTKLKLDPWTWQKIKDDFEVLVSF